MKQGESTVPSNVEPAKAKYTNPGQKRCLGRVRECSNTISYMKICIRTDCQVKDRDLRFNSKINETRSRCGTEQKEKSNPIG
jgi:hypothetical protein